VTLEILTRFAGRRALDLQHRSGADARPRHRPAGYDKICQQNPGAPNCRVPLYWPAPQVVVSTKKGMHRFSGICTSIRSIRSTRSPVGDDDAPGAVPRSHVSAGECPLGAGPGEYTVRLTVDGTSRPDAAAPAVLDPRVKTPAADLERLTTLSREMYDGAVAAHRAFLAAKELAQQVGGLTGAAADTLKADLEELAPTGVQRNLRAFRRRGGPATAPRSRR
jgi:hypothetical protein